MVAAEFDLPAGHLDAPAATPTPFPVDGRPESEVLDDVRRRFASDRYEPDRGSLYRFERIEPVWRSNAVTRIYDAFQKADRTTVPRVAERIAHLQLLAFNADGYSYISNNTPNLSFDNNDLPSYLDLELGVIEPRPYDRFRARYDSNNVNTPIALAYLTNQLDRLHLFRQRIPIRTLQ